MRKNCKKKCRFRRGMECITLLQGGVVS